MPTWTVYLLIDPRDGEIHYVGGTKQNLNYRLTAHIKEAFRSGTRKNDKSIWIRELYYENLKPMLEPLVSYENARDMAFAESAWIRRLQAAGCQLFNNPRPYHIKPDKKSTELSAAKVLQSYYKKKKLNVWQQNLAKRLKKGAGS